MGIKDVSNEEITPTVVRYMIKDLDEKVTSNHSEMLTRIGRMESKIDMIITQYNCLKVENAELKKDVYFNKEKIGETRNLLVAIGLVVLGGVIKFLFDIVKL